MFRGFAVTAAIASVSTFALVCHAAMSVAEKGGISFDVAAGPLKVDKGEKRGDSVAPIKFTGSTNDLSVTEADGKLTFSANLKTVKTGMDGRDEHFKKHFAKGDGKVQFVVDKASLKIPADGAVAKGTAEGELKLLGKSHKVKIPYSAKRQGSDYLLGSQLGQTDLKFTFEYTWFTAGGEQVCEMGVCVRPWVDVTIKKLKLRE